MAFAGSPPGSLREAQTESSRLVWAFVLSLVVHLMVWGGYKGGKSAFSWIEIHRPSWLAQLKLAQKKPVPLPKPAEPPVLMLEQPPQISQYVDVSQAQATAEPPKSPRFVSSKNSQAANPDIDKESDIPKIDGQRTDVIKADDVQRQERITLKPVLPQTAPRAPEDQPEEKPKPAPPAGDMMVAKAEPKPREDQGTAERPRPRTIKEALARLPDDSGIPGRKMKQTGGVKRRLTVSAMDAKATLFGAYQERLVAAIVQRWYDLLDERAYTMENGGKVVINFSVHYDGTVTGVGIANNSTGAEVLGYVCVKAIEDPAPFEAWPSDMRHEIAKGVFDVQFTFLY